MKPKILCVCAVGLNRSKYLAKYLRGKGYSTRYGGVDYRWEEGANPLKQEDVDWADSIIITRKRLYPIIKKKFKTQGKKIIVFDVTDSQRLAPKEFKNLSPKEFQKKWTYSQLRKAIKPYLPLK